MATALTAGRRAYLPNIDAATEHSGQCVAVADVEFRWKEEIIYWDGDRGVVFDGGWGVSPLVTYVPSEERWDAVVPDWLRGRRAEVLDRLEQEDGHVLRDDASFRADPAREVFRA